ncbi:hypothetical protein O3P69_000914 [Scylla paramamosain]|uniref:Uncharacterized protein n=1 Tax=Scylla paramamosain TaxID=85552 RepID=A0AAW0UWQ1_SCYPA
MLHAGNQTFKLWRKKKCCSSGVVDIDNTQAARRREPRKRTTTTTIARRNHVPRQTLQWEGPSRRRPGEGKDRDLHQGTGDKVRECGWKALRGNVRLACGLKG